jgi:hypothetical protein
LEIALIEKELTDQSLLEMYNEERRPVISELFEMTTDILTHTPVMGELTSRRSPKLSMLGINYRFSNTVLDEFPRQFTQAYQHLRGLGQGTRRTRIAPHLAQRLWRDDIVQSL